MSTTQKIIVWDDPALDAGSIQSLYEMVFTEYELREKRRESLTPQRNYTHSPAAVLDQRNKSLTQAAAEVETAAADVDDGRKSNPKKKVSEEDRRLAQQWTCHKMDAGIGEL